MIAVHVDQLSKGYRQYSRPIDSLIEWLTRKPRHQMFWALQGVSFELDLGDTLGIIGDNGAGKSTLLKLLAGTLTPTLGECRINGRVSAILELGSGFHPEFSGLENIRMGCAMLGLRNKETERLLPEIIAFSELGDAVKRPVKTYSSGMYVRLAFSVVTSVNPDILVIDEALSVGDQHFQKKSLDRIRAFIDQGKTLVFCSHNLYQVKSLCNRVAWLDHGIVKMLDAADRVVEAYTDHSRSQNGAEAVVEERAAATADSEAWIEQAELDRGDGGSADYACGETLCLRVQVHSARLAREQMSLAVVIMRNDNLHVYGTSTEIDGVKLVAHGQHRYQAQLRFPHLQLLSGSFSFYLYLLDEHGLHIYDKREDCLPFKVSHVGREVGVARLSHVWGSA
jgi:lipopolysaccharide transport system ATP-binding protein